MIDHDQLFKKPLKEFFLEFVAVFLPGVSVYLDPTRLEFLDKELFTDLSLGDRRNADLVAVEVKKECLRIIARLKYEPEKMRFLSGFVDTYLRSNIAAATSLGANRLLRLPANVTTIKVRLRITKSPVSVALSDFGLFAE